MTDGWIKLHRKFIDWEWRQDPNMVSLFIHLLLEANHEPHRWMGIEINQGQLVTGRLKLSVDTGITEQTIRTCLNKLKSTNEITIKSTNKYSIITITKWDTYQGNKPKSNQQTNQQTNQQLTNNQPTTNHKQEVKKERSKEIKNKTYSEIVIPSDINPETWNAFIEMRKTMKKPMTDHAKNLILLKLNTIGQDKNKVLNQSIENSWIGVFPIKDAGSNGQGKTVGKDEVDWDIVRQLNEMGAKHGTDRV
jgi:hypothetical protein